MRHSMRHPRSRQRTGANNCDFSGLPTNCDVLVRAYDAETGILLWEDQGDVMGTDEFFTGAAVDRGKVFASGSVFDTDVSSDLVIRAYDAGADHDE